MRRIGSKLFGTNRCLREPCGEQEGNIPKMMGDKKKVSLYIPCLNAEQFIGKCIDAILYQTRVPDEIIVVDDGSTDRTAEVASCYRVKVASHSVNRGLGAARNTGIRNFEW